MNSEEIIILFIYSYQKGLYNGKLNLKESQEKIVKTHLFNEILIEGSKYKDYQFDIQEIKINKQTALESKKHEVEMILSLSTHNNENNVTKYEATFNFNPSRSNFLFDYKIGCRLDKEIKGMKINYNKGCNLEFSEIFYSFYDYINNKMSPKYQIEMIESLGEDTKKYLEKNKNENIQIKFEIIFFLLINSKNQDISLLLELINKRNFTYFPYDKIFKKDDIILFVEEIISNLEKDENSWPFDEIRKFDKKGDEEEVEENKIEKEDKINTEDRFMEFLIGYFCVYNRENNLSLFFKNEKLKNKTSKSISKIKDYKYINKIGRNKFMDFFGKEKEILPLLDAQTNFIQYLSIINSNFSDLYELINKVGLNTFKIKDKLVSFYDNFEEINKLHRQILNKEKNINNFYIDFLSCVGEYILLFKNNNLDKLINLIDYIEDEKKINYEQIKIIKPFEDALGSNINETILYYIKKRYFNNFNETKYYIEIIPKIKTFFIKFNENDKFAILEASNINSNNAKDILKIIISDKINELFSINSYAKYFNTITNNIIGIHYLPEILQIIPEEKYTKEIADKLFNWVNQNFQNYQPSMNIKLEALLNSVFKILLKQNSSNSNKFLKQIKKSFNDKFVLKCFLIFIRNNPPKNINDDIIDYFTNSLNKKSFSEDSTILPYILQELKELKNITTTLFNKIKIFVIKEVEFFENYEVTLSIKLINDLIKINFFKDKKYEKEEYTKKTIEVIKSIKAQIENSSLNCQKAIEILNIITPNAITKFKILFLYNDIDREKEANNLFQNFKLSILKVMKIIQDLEQINRYFNEFYKASKSNEISKIKDLIYKIKNSKLNEVDNIQKTSEYLDLAKYYELSKNIELKKSHCFNQIYNEQLFLLNKDNPNEGQFDEEALFKKSKEKLNEMKIIFENNIVDNDTENLRFLLEVALRDNKELLIEELYFLTKYFNMDINIEKMNEIKYNIIIFAQINKINYSLLGLLYLYKIFEINIEKTNDSEEIINKIKLYIDELKNEKKEKEKIQEIKKYLQSLNIVLDEEIENVNKNINKNGIIFYEFLKLMQNNPESITFAKGQKENNIKHLLDFLVESDGKKNLQENDIQAFIKTVKFLETLQNNKFSFSDLIKQFNTVITDQNNELYLGENINIYIKSYNGIKILYNESLNKSESSSLKISMILNNSIAKITYYGITIEYYINEKKNILNFEDIEELRERAIVMKSYLKKNKNEVNEEKIVGQNYYNVKIFVDIIQKIKLLKHYLDDLINIGMPNPNNFSISVEILNKANQKAENLDYFDIDCEMYKQKFKLEKLINYLYSLKEDIENQTEEFYINNEYIRFFYGKILDFINQSLKLEKYDELLPIFKVITNKNISNNIPKHIYHLDKNLEIQNNNYINENDYFNDERFDKGNNDGKDYINKEIDEKFNPLNNFVNMLVNISEYFQKVLKENNILSIEQLFKCNEINRVEQKEKYRGVFIINCSDENNDKKVIIYFKELTNSYPIRSTFLLCNEETNKEEITSFLFRAFLCPIQTLFILSKSDSLTKANKIYLVMKISELLKIYKNTMKSMLIILHSDEDSEIKKGFNIVKDVNIFHNKFDQKIKDDQYINSFEKIKKTIVIKSDLCGVGKSTKIASIIKNTSIVYIYFQIGGVFTRKNLFERVKKEMLINNENKKYLIHIDLVYSELDELIKEFLFKFLIMRYYDYDNNVFCYSSNNVEIYIEIHNEIHNYLEKYPILKFCNCETLNSIKLLPLIEDKNFGIKSKKVENSKIQIVSQIFQYLKEKKIGLKNIDLNSNNILPLNNIKEKNNENNLFSCQQLIDYYFNNKVNNEIIEIKNPNYYQKKMFIDLLADQFTKFTKSIYYQPEILFENFTVRYSNKKLAREKTSEIRELIINSLINNTKLFVKGPYENIIKEQKQTDSYLKSNNEQQNENAINQLAKEKLETMITYDNINQSIFAFDDLKDSIGIKIIPSSRIKDEEYEKLNELYNTQTPLDKPLIKIEKPKEKENNGKLIEDLLDLLGVEENLKEITKKNAKAKFVTYVFTTDNYIKMIHILMKTRAKVPVIMMGETGCGKTSLIKMLSLLKNKGEMRMKIMNIHEGIDDEEIISFIENIMKKTDEEDQNIIIQEKNKYYEAFNEQNKNKIIENKIDESTIKKEDKIKESKKDTKIKEDKKKDKKKADKKKDNKKENNKIKDEENKKEKNETNDENDIIKSRDILFKKIEKDIRERQMWIFFDEINTCHSMGLLSEIFCNHTYRGKTIPDRYIFIGACNPYRILSDKSKNLEFGLYLKNKKRKNLVYTVNPLPHSLLNYVIDFGELTKKDTELYIESILKEVIEYKDNLLRLAVNLVTKSHLFIKDNNDVSSVSLRDIKYFIIFYNGFIEYFKYLRKLAIEENINRISNKMNDYKDMSDYAIKEQSIILSIYISYYLRLPTKKLRKDLCDILNNDKYLKSKNDFLNGPLRESNFLLNQIAIDPTKGIAKNNALRENIFCEFFCLINKVPLIICGKPGNSKTLSVQLLLDSMKGSSSFNDFFKNPKYKEVVTYPFQGSTTCTSKGVIQTFEKARKYASKNSNLMNILVFFDEMGLAEDSPTNPLKVLHSELENDDNKFAFFGLTNWALDASKMNRGIRICVQEPDEDDLIYTANEIAKSIDQKIFIENNKLFEYLSKSYFKYKENMSGSGYKDFHGNRDFYNLIRTTMKYLKEENKSIEDNPNKNLETIQTICAIKAIERNFGGLKNSVIDMKKIFYKISNYPDINHQYNIKECIEDNFKDPNSRYLLLISKNSTSQNLIEHIIKNENKESTIFIGSQFKGDNSESYTEDVLYKIQIQMENNVILTLKGLEIIYPSLYDLFNQNFSEINGNKYAKISFSNNQSTSIVNNGFKVIVLVDEEMITYEDKPFLNRFEKHIISFENILIPKYVNLVKEIGSNIKELIEYGNNNEEKDILGINLKKQLISCDKEIIENMVFNLSNNNINMTDKEIKLKIFEVIAPTLTQDIISCFNINGFKQREPEITDIILKSYIKLYSSNISEYLKNIPNILYSRSIIYTFSNITEPIFIGNEIKNEKLGIDFKKETTTEIILDSVDTTNNFEQLINLFYKSHKNLCIIKFEIEDLNKMNNIKNIIDYTEKIESTRNPKFYFFIVYMKRELLVKNKNYNEKLNKKITIKDQIPLMSDFMQITIDNINNQILNFNITNLFTNENNSYIINTLFNVKDLINDNIYNILDKLKYKIINKKEEFNINNYKATISNEIIKNDFLMEKIIEA